MKKLYYAHPIDIYNTPQELRDIIIIEKLFGKDYEINNPNSEHNEKEYKIYGMEYFTNQVKNCDLVVFRGYPTGMIPAGVFKEINVAIENGIPVIELPSLVGGRMSVEDTRQFIKEIGTR